MRTLTLLIALATFAPLPAQAYLTPEEVIESGDFVDAPPNARGAKAARAAQEAEYDARAADQAARDEAADASTPPADNTIDGLHNAAADTEAVDWNPAGDGLTPDERRDDRVLQRVERNRLDDMAQNGVVLRGSAPDEPLHGGAPLAPTGMGTVMAVLAVVAASAFTLGKALRA